MALLKKIVVKAVNPGPLVSYHVLRGYDTFVNEVGEMGTQGDVIGVPQGMENVHEFLYMQYGGSEDRGDYMRNLWILDQGNNVFLLQEENLNPEWGERNSLYWTKIGEVGSGFCLASCFGLVSRMEEPTKQYIFNDNSDLIKTHNGNIMLHWKTTYKALLKDNDESWKPAWDVQKTNAAFRNMATELNIPREEINAMKINLLDLIVDDNPKMYIITLGPYEPHKPGDERIAHSFLYQLDQNHNRSFFDINSPKDGPEVKSTISIWHALAYATKRLQYMKKRYKLSYGQHHQNVVAFNIGE